MVLFVSTHAVVGLHRVVVQVRNGFASLYLQKSLVELVLSIFVHPGLDAWVFFEGSAALGHSEATANETGHVDGFLVGCCASHAISQVEVGDGDLRLDISELLCSCSAH